jgi:anti-sigma B factor antagonist
VEGEVDLSTAHSLRARVDQLIHEGARRLVVDLERSGLSALVTARKRIQEVDGEIAIVCRQDSVLKVFTVTGLDRVFRIADSVAEATAS